MRDLRQGVRLVHELGQLRGAEELAHRRRRRLRVDEVVRHHGVDVDRRHALADRPLHAQQADTVLVLHQLADRPDATVAEVVDVVDLAAAVLQLEQDLQDEEDVLLAQDAHLIVGLDVQARVHLHAADGREVVALQIEEQALEERLGRLKGRRLARAHDPVDVDERILAAGVAVRRHRVAQVRADVDVVDRQHRELLEAGLHQLVEHALGDLVAGLEEDLAVVFVDDVDGQIAADQVLVGDQLLLQPLVDQLAGEARGDLRARLGDDRAGGRVDQVAGDLDALHAVGVELGHPALVGPVVGDDAVEGGEDLLLRHALRLVGLQLLAVGGAGGPQLLRLLAVERVEQRRRRQLPAAVDAHVEQVLGVELEVEPAAAVGDDAGGEQVLARAVGLALVVVEEHAGRPVHLRDDDTFGAIDDEGAVGRHERHVAHVDVLLLDVADRAQARVLVHVEDGEAQGHLQRRGEGHAALLALVDVVLRLLEFVAHEIEDCALGEVLDRKDRPEHLLQTDVLPPVVQDVHLEEVIVGAALHLDEVRHPDDLRNAPEAHAHTLTAGERLRHGSPF